MIREQNQTRGAAGFAGDEGEAGGDPCSGVRPGGGVASTEAEIVWLEDIDHLDYLR
ncbi:hypothetical protein AB0I02_27885 [Streptomyces phaeochromogenes]